MSFLEVLGNNLLPNSFRLWALCLGPLLAPRGLSPVLNLECAPHHLHLGTSHGILTVEVSGIFPSAAFLLPSRRFKSSVVRLDPPRQSAYSAHFRVHNLNYICEVSLVMRCKLFPGPRDWQGHLWQALFGPPPELSVPPWWGSINWKKVEVDLG